MNPRRVLVADANILMRAVLGRRVRELLEVYEDAASFYSPDVCFDDARHYVSQILEKRGLNPESGLSALAQLEQALDRIMDENTASELLQIGGANQSPTSQHQSIVELYDFAHNPTSQKVNVNLW